MSFLTEVREAARFYHRHGANVFAIEPGTKKPFLPWKRWQTRRQTVTDVQEQSWRWAGGIAIISGIGDWRCFDSDQCPSSEVIMPSLKALGLPADYPWIVMSGSGRGWHVWVRCAEELPAGLLATKEGERGVYTAPGEGFAHLELRWASCYTITPPSGHPSGGTYQFVGDYLSDAPAVVSADRIVAAFRAVTRADRPATPVGLTVRVRGIARRRDNRLAALKATFDLLAFAQEVWPGKVMVEGEEVRISAQGGLLLKPWTGQWYCFADEVGGDAIDLVGYARFGMAWNRRDKAMFKVALREAVALAGAHDIVPENSEGYHIQIQIAGSRRPMEGSESDTAGSR
jgi:Bifunctional DNA primase/polymerase, N-terminal